MTSERFQLGDTVEWRTRSVTYHGEVVAVVPAGELPGPFAVREAGKWAAARWDLADAPRNHESYIVAVFPDGGGIVTRFHRPRVTGLRKVEG